MAYGRSKSDNEYARLVFDIDAPKTVWMAIAFSLAMRTVGNNDATDARNLLMSEWQALYDNGIVPQKPKRDK